MSVAYEKLQKRAQELEAHNVQQNTALQEELLQAILPSEVDPSVPPEVSQLETIQPTTHALETLSTLGLLDSQLIAGRKEASM
jgi:hypothetical protein